MKASDNMKSESALFEFSWTDAWVFTSLYCSHKNGVEINLPLLLRSGEDLNFNTFRLPELNESLNRLSRKGIIQIKDDHVSYPPLGKQLISKARFWSASWFSRVDITLKILNSSETGTAEDQASTRNPIISQEKYNEAYTEYLGQPAQPIAYEAE